MAIFHIYVCLPEGNMFKTCCSSCHGFSSPGHRSVGSGSSLGSCAQGAPVTWDTPFKFRNDITHYMMYKHLWYVYMHIICIYIYMYDIVTEYASCIKVVQCIHTVFLLFRIMAHVLAISLKHEAILVPFLRYHDVGITFGLPGLPWHGMDVTWPCHKNQDALHFYFSAASLHDW